MFRLGYKLWASPNPANRRNKQVNFSVGDAAQAGLIVDAVDQVAFRPQYLPRILIYFLRGRNKEVLGQDTWAEALRSR